MISNLKFLSFAAVVFCVGYSHAITEEDRASLGAAMGPFISACSEEHGVSRDQYIETRKKYTTEGIKPCFFSCLLKKAEVMDSKGIYQADKSIEFGKAHIKSGDIENYTKIANHCAKVNDISDGEEGCERAKQFFDCLDEQIKEYKLN